MSPALLVVPSILKTFLESFRGVVVSRSFTMVLGSKKFSLAPLSIKADSTIRVVVKTAAIFIAFLVVLATRVYRPLPQVEEVGPSKNPHWL